MNVREKKVLVVGSAITALIVGPGFLHNVSDWEAGVLEEVRVGRANVREARSLPMRLAAVETDLERLRSQIGASASLFLSGTDGPLLLLEMTQVVKEAAANAGASLSQSVTYIDSISKRQTDDLIRVRVRTRFEGTPESVVYFLMFLESPEPLLRIQELTLARPNPVVPTVSGELIVEGIGFPQLPSISKRSGAGNGAD